MLNPATGTDETADVRVRRGVVEFPALGPPEPDCRIMDCRDLWAFPGLVDLHVHLRTPGDPRAETLETGLRAALAGGVTTVGMMPNTRPPLEDPLQVEELLRKVRDLRLADAVPVPRVTRSDGSRCLTDLEAFASMGIRAFSDDGLPVMPDEALKEAFRRTALFGGVVIEHPENPDLSRGGVVNLGPVSESLGVPGVPEEAEWSDVARCIALLEGTGARLHLTHLSSPESVRLSALAASRGLSVTCDTTPHHLALNHCAVLRKGTLAKMNPPLRSEESRGELAGMVRRGLVQAVASDHAPHTAESKGKPMASSPFGVTGVETLLPVTLEVLAGREGMSPLSVITLLTTAPAAVLNLPSPDLSRKDADTLVLFDPAREWEYDGGMSLSKNTPFLGSRLRGKVLFTLCGGRLFP